MAGRLMIAGSHSGVGKTTITVGLIEALRHRGLSVQPFKVGPDYIDPTYHTLAAARPCRNLDTWMLPAERVRDLFERAAQSADLAVIEGVMGLYDGFGYSDETGSSAEVAKLLDCPVVLVLDASKMARSAGAIALGYRRFDEHTPLAGFIVNRTASAQHGRGVTMAIEQATGLPVFGWLPRAAPLQVPERHLGLVPTVEPGRWEEFTRTAGDAVARNVDIDALLTVARPFGHDATAERGLISRSAGASRRTGGKHPVIAVARDEAFHFTYEDNLDLLRDAGANIALFSPLHDTALPERTAGIILGGGFPEIYAERLAANRAMHAALRAAHERMLPIYAECGGLMYLAESIIDGRGGVHPMVGLLPGHCRMAGRLTLGYRTARCMGDSWFLRAGETIRGHEFHYSTWEGRRADLPAAYDVLPRSGEGVPCPEGARVGNLWASYVHVHFGAMPVLAERFVTACHAAVAGGVR
jgi:cobyrinic acid a,c-diamide synthase